MFDELVKVAKLSIQIEENRKQASRDSKGGTVYQTMVNEDSLDVVCDALIKLFEEVSSLKTNLNLKL